MERWYTELSCAQWGFLPCVQFGKLWRLPGTGIEGYGWTFVQTGVNCLRIAGIVHLFEFCAGRVLYTDDKRTLATSEPSLQVQVAMVNKFVTSNSLHLNLTKCKTVAQGPESGIPNTWLCPASWRSWEKLHYCTYSTLHPLRFTSPSIKGFPLLFA